MNTAIRNLIEPGSFWFTAYLVLTAIACGALVMVIEVLGSRVIGPYFGVSLYVWTSLITVTLVSLAVGYGLGGMMADRWHSPGVLYLIILLAGVTVFVIPWVSDATLAMAMPLGLRLGALLSATLLFGPSLFLLGCVSPYLVRIAARSMRSIGRTVGGFYALSTFGSVLGTAVTGFVLITWLGVDRIFFLAGTVLVALSAVYFLLFRKLWQPALLLLLPVYWLATFHDGPRSITLSNGFRITVLEDIESRYGNLKVVDYQYQDNHSRELLIDGRVQSGIDVGTGLSVYQYAYLLQFIPHALHPSGRRSLVLGLGAGLISAWYEEQGIQTRSIDIDPAVVRFAREYFNFSNEFEVGVQDARYALASDPSAWDFLILDVASGDQTPGHLFSMEAAELYASRLTPEGVLGINLVGSIGQDSLMTASVVHTLRQRFDQVEIYPVFDVRESDGVGNLIVAAYQGPPRTIDWQAVRKFKVSAGLSQRFWNNIGQRFEFPEDTPAMILTDDYNPMDFFNAVIHEKIRRDIIRYTDSNVL